MNADRGAEPQFDAGRRGGALKPCEIAVEQLPECEETPRRPLWNALALAPRRVETPWRALETPSAGRGDPVDQPCRGLGMQSRSMWLLPI